MQTAPEGAVGIASWRRGWDGFGPSMGLTLRCAQGSLRLSKSAFHADLSNLGLSSRPPSPPDMQTAPRGAVSMHVWRRGWDSNPRWYRYHGGFQDRCLKPLGHLSRPRILAEARSCDLREIGAATRLAAGGISQER